MRYRLLIAAAIVGLVAGCSVKTNPQPSSHSADASKPASPPVSSPLACERESFSGAEAYEILQRLVTLERFYGAKGRPAAIQYLRKELEGTTDRVDAQELSVVEPLSNQRYGLTNIIGHQNSASKQRQLLASHWDTRLWAEEDANPAKRGSPAAYANDGGSGVAVLLALSRHTKSFSKIGLDFVLFDGEEFGRPHSNDYCKGSEHFAREYQRNNTPRPQNAIVLDMVGDADLDIYYEVTSMKQAPDLTTRIWRTAKSLGVSAFHPAPKYSIVDDHSPLQEIGIPSVLLIDYDYPYWHTHGDTIDKVSPKSLEMVGRVLLGVMCEKEREARL